MPVRIPVPSRDEWFAAGLSILALGLVLGLATGPVGGSGVIFPAFAAPAAEVVSEGDSDEVVLPALGSPAGSAGGPTVASTSPPAPVPASVPPPAPAPTPNPVLPPTEPPAGGGGGGGGTGGQRDVGQPVTATVVSVAVTGKSYAVADRFGNLFSIFGEGSPVVGDRIKTSIEPLVNGTFVELAGRKSLGRQTAVSLRGVVSYLDPETGIVVISSRGVSVALEGSSVFDQPIDALRKGAEAEAEVEVVEDGQPDAGEPRRLPNLSIVSLEASYYQGSAIELTGRLKVVDPSTRTVRFAADSGGLLEAEVEAVVPSELDPSSLKVGFVYSVTLREASDGTLGITGLSPAWGRKPANDPAFAFGEHG